MNDQQKYAGLAGNQNASKPEGQSKRGFTIHVYVPYPKVRKIRKELGKSATSGQVQDRAVQVAKDALEALYGDEDEPEGEHL